MKKMLVTILITILFVSLMYFLILELVFSKAAINYFNQASAVENIVMNVLRYLVLVLPVLVLIVVIYRYLIKNQTMI